MIVGLQPSKVRPPRRRSPAAEESITLDQKRPPSRAPGRHGSRDPGRPAAEHGDFIFAVERQLAGGFFGGFGRQCRVPIDPGATMPWLADFALPPRSLHAAQTTPTCGTF